MNVNRKKMAMVVISLFFTFSLAIAASFYPYGIVWNEKDTGNTYQVRYRHWDGTQWSETTDFGNQNFKIEDTDTNHWTPHLAYDFYSRPVICFIDERNGASGASDLKCGVWNSTHWEITVLDSYNYGYVQGDWDYGPRMAMSPDGKVGVVWSEYGDYDKWFVRFREWDGHRWSNMSDYPYLSTVLDPFHHMKRQYSNYQFWFGDYHQRAPEIAYDMFGQPVVTITWYSHTTLSYYYVYTCIFRYDLNRWWCWNLDNPDLNYNYYDWYRAPRMAMSPNGKVGIAWSYTSGNDRIRFREWDAYELKMSSRYEFGAIPSGSPYYYVDNSGGEQYAPHVVYSGDSRPFVSFYESTSADNEIVQWTGTSWTSQKIDSGLDDTSSGDNEMYEMRTARGPDGRVGVVWCERDGANKYYVRFREYDGLQEDSWTQNSDYGNQKMKVYGAYWEFMPDLIYDHNNYPVIVFYTAHYTAGDSGHTVLSKWTGASWSSTFLESTDKGEVEDTSQTASSSANENLNQDDNVFHRRPYIERPLSNFWLRIIDDNGEFIKGKPVSVLRQSNQETLFTMNSMGGGGFYTYLNDSVNYDVQVGVNGSFAYGLKKESKVFMRYYDKAVSLANLTVTVENAGGAAQDKKQVKVVESGSKALSFQGETNTQGQIKVALDASKSYNVLVAGHTIENIALPFNLTVNPLLPETSYYEPTLITFTGDLSYANATVPQKASVELTIKDDSENIIWGPYTFEDIASQGTFGLTLGGQNQLNVMTGKKYALYVNFCDLASFTKAAGYCQSGSTHYESFTTYFLA